MTTTYKIKAGAPVSGPQADLFRRLAHELGKDPQRVEDALATKDRAGISAIIDQLFAEQKAIRAAKPVAQTQPGYYLAQDDVYVVVPNKAKTRTYAKKLVIRTGADGANRASWDYVPGAIYNLEGLHPLTVQEAARLGHLHGICVVCARQLTDPKSVEMGIGPVCVKRLAK